MAKKIRVHNQGKREYTIPPETKKDKKKGEKKGEKKGKNRMLLPGRAIELEEDTAKKYLKAYPRDLIEFDSLVTGEKRNLNKENARLESENETLTEKNDQLKLDNETLTDDNQKLKDKVQGFESNTDPDVQTLKDRVSDLEKDLEEATKPKETDAGQGGSDTEKKKEE